MATYECGKCGMSVNASCGHCATPLYNDMLELSDGNQVQISKYPNGHTARSSHPCAAGKT